MVAWHSAKTVLTGTHWFAHVIESAAPGSDVQVDALPIPAAYPIPMSDVAPVTSANIAAMARPTTTVAAVAMAIAVADDTTGTLEADPAAGVRSGGVITIVAIM